jgi:hypothetical protein
MSLLPIITCLAFDIKHSHVVPSTSLVYSFIHSFIPFCIPLHQTLTRCSFHFISSFIPSFLFVFPYIKHSHVVSSTTLVHSFIYSFIHSFLSVFPYITRLLLKQLMDASTHSEAVYMRVWRAYVCVSQVAVSSALVLM